MAWNGSDGQVDGQRPEAKQTSGKYRNAPLKHGVIAGLVVVAFGGAALWWMMGGDERNTGERVVKGERDAITEVMPQIPTNRAEAVAEVAKPKPVDPNARPTKVGEVLNGYVMLPSGRLHRRTGVITNSFARANKPKYAIFDRWCNNNIATLLALRPGDSLVGTPRYDGRFKQDFIASLQEPIYVAHDDTPEQAQLKRDVIDARIKLKEAMDRGEDIEQIMLDTRKELQDLARVKQSVRMAFKELKKNCETEQDVEDALAACNKMLEAKGIAPLKCGSIAKRNLLRTQQEEQGADKEQ